METSPVESGQEFVDPVAKRNSIITEAVGAENAQEAIALFQAVLAENVGKEDQEVKAWQAIAEKFNQPSLVHEGMIGMDRQFKEDGTKIGEQVLDSQAEK